MPTIIKSTALYHFIVNQYHHMAYRFHLAKLDSLTKEPQTNRLRKRYTDKMDYHKNKFNH